MSTQIKPFRIGELAAEKTVSGPFFSEGDNTAFNLLPGMIRKLIWDHMVPQKIEGKWRGFHIETSSDRYPNHPFIEVGTSLEEVNKAWERSKKWGCCPDHDGFEYFIHIPLESHHVRVLKRMGF